MAEEEAYESTQEDELRKQNRLTGLDSENSLSLSLPVETVRHLLCTSPTSAIQCITDSDIARNLPGADSLKSEVVQRDDNQIVIEDDEFFLNVPSDQVGMTEGVAGALMKQIETTDDPAWNDPLPGPSNAMGYDVSQYATVNKWPAYDYKNLKFQIKEDNDVVEFVSPAEEDKEGGGENADIEKAPVNEPCTPFCISQGTTSNESDFQTYGFDVTIEATSKRKASDYVYNESDNCLFAKPFVFIPFEVSCKTDPPPESFVRVCAFYTQGTYASQPVRRCPHHLATDESGTRDHFVVAESMFATYVEARWAGERPHLTVPYPKPGDPPFVPLKFQCYSSCIGGVNRRSIFLSITLEANGEVLGHKKITLKVCACPSRDAAADGFEPPPKKRRTVALPAKTEVVTKSTEPTGSSFKEDDDTIYQVQIRGRHLYKVICAIMESYEYGRRYLKEKKDEAVDIHPLESLSRPLSQRTSIASWLAGLKLSKYVKKFHSKSLHVLDDLEGVINKKFLKSIGVEEADITAVLSSYLSWFDVYRAQRLSSLSSVGSTIRVQRTRLRSTIREPS